jgi:hypothetical protein
VRALAIWQALASAFVSAAAAALAAAASLLLLLLLLLLALGLPAFAWQCPHAGLFPCGDKV